MSEAKPDWAQAAEQAAEDATEQAAEQAADVAEESATKGVSDRVGDVINVKLPEPLTREVPDIEVSQIQERFGVPEHFAYLIRAGAGLVKINPLNSGAGSNTVIADIGRAILSYARRVYALRQMQQAAQDHAEDNDSDTDSDTGGEDEMPEGQGPMQ